MRSLKANFGEEHMFIKNVKEYDYDDIITNKTKDDAIYNRYTEIEKLGQDVDLPEHFDVYKSSTLKQESADPNLFSKEEGL